MKLVRGFYDFWYDFIVGDDWKVAVAVVTALVVTGALMAVGLSDTVVTVVGSLLVLVAFSAALSVDQARRGRDDG